MHTINLWNQSVSLLWLKTQSHMISDVLEVIQDESLKVFYSDGYSLTLAIVIDWFCKEIVATPWPSDGSIVLVLRWSSKNLLWLSQFFWQYFQETVKDFLKSEFSTTKRTGRYLNWRSQVMLYLTTILKDLKIFRRHNYWASALWKLTSKIKINTCISRERTTYVRSAILTSASVLSQ